MSCLLPLPFSLLMAANLRLRAAWRSIADKQLTVTISFIFFFFLNGARSYAIPFLLATKGRQGKGNIWNYLLQFCLHLKTRSVVTFLAQATLQQAVQFATECHSRYARLQDRTFVQFTIRITQCLCIGFLASCHAIIFHF